MVVHPGGPGRRAQGHGDLFVLEALLRPQQEDLALQPRQPAQALLQALLRFPRHRALVGIAVARPELLAEGHDPYALRPAPRVLQDVPPDRKQPGAELALPPKLRERAKRADERFLHDVVEVGLGRAGTREEAGQRLRMPAHQLRRSWLVASPPGGDRRRIGRHGGEGLGGTHAFVTMDVAVASILRPRAPAGPDPARRALPLRSLPARSSFSFEHSFEPDLPHAYLRRTPWTPPP